MARINNLTDFLTDVSTAIKQKTGDTTPIPASEFDTEILKIETKGNYQEKEIEITENGNITLLPDTGYDAMSKVHISVDMENGIMTEAEYETALNTTELILTGLIAERVEYVQDGLVSHLDLDGNFTDKKGVVTVSNSGLVFTYNSELMRNVVQTTTSSSSIRATLSSPNIDLSSFTLSIRAKSSGTNTSEHNMLLGCYGSSTGTSFGIKAHYGKYSIERYLDSIDSTYNVNTDSEWHRYTVTLENKTTVKMYVDDELVLEQTGTYNVVPTSWLLGNYISGYSMAWKGQYYGALIYNRALTQEEISQNVSADKEVI